MLHLLVALLGGNMVLSSYAAKGWVRLPMFGPGNFSNEDSSANLYYVNNILLGTPPASLSLPLDASSPSFIVNSESCILCGGSDDFFDSSLSTSFVSLNKTRVTESTIVSFCQDKLSFGGIVGPSSGPSAIESIDWLQGQFEGSATTTNINTIFGPQTKAGFYVDIVNASLRASHPLTQLHDQGFLQNPVVGFSLKTAGNESHITIGALDQEDYVGELNWVEAEVPQPDWELPTVISIDAIGLSEIKETQKILFYLNTIIANIMLPFISYNYSEFEPVTSSSIFEDILGGSWNCDNMFDFIGHGLTASTNPTFPLINNTDQGLLDPEHQLPIVINGVTYKVDIEKNVAISNDTSLVPPELSCVLGLLFNNSTTSSVQGSLGLPFFRSAYVAYRFPTTDCPKAFYGFAFQKDSNVPASLIAQKPRSTPTSSAQCLQFSSPTETPTLNIPSIPQESIGYNGNFKVFRKEDAQEVPLINAEELMGVDWPMPT
ncbi:hypothetical protein M422DRAFT_260576 [Sphaerobolus stellatus SS14]|uniref:Peptidase A1 domain-containing protein n=1 Tax=Sphaerobolus stellatus (strain SS14) TaxID=990650 RepID=A0A0C9V5X1_SPHS4|nr:hypothetical protein M422DRAFT_260576 [Sphaerobolus stellatus SS14]